jgi:glucose dehydrogenase
LSLTEEIQTWPHITGGTNWFPYSFNPRTGLAYVNTADFGMNYKPDPIEEIRNLKPGESHRAVKIAPIFNSDGIRGHLRAIDPMTGKSKWATPFKSPNWAGTLVTEGGLVFTGQLTGEFIAVDSETGKIVWQFQTPSGIIGQPVTWEHNGKQYVTVTSGGRRLRPQDGRPQFDACAAGWDALDVHAARSVTKEHRVDAAALRAAGCSRASLWPAQFAFWPPV